MPDDDNLSLWQRAFDAAQAPGVKPGKPYEIGELGPELPSDPLAEVRVFDTDGNLIATPRVERVAEPLRFIAPELDEEAADSEWFAAHPRFMAAYAASSAARRSGGHLHRVDGELKVFPGLPDRLNCPICQANQAIKDADPTSKRLGTTRYGIKMPAQDSGSVFLEAHDRLTQQIIKSIMLPAQPEAALDEITSRRDHYAMPWNNPRRQQSEEIHTSEASEFQQYTRWGRDNPPLAAGQPSPAIALRNNKDNRHMHLIGAGLQIVMVGIHPRACPLCYAAARPQDRAHRRQAYLMMGDVSLENNIHAIQSAIQGELLNNYSRRPGWSGDPVVSELPEFPDRYDSDGAPVWSTAVNRKPTRSRLLLPLALEKEITVNVPVTISGALNIDDDVPAIIYKRDNGEILFAIYDDGRVKLGDVADLDAASRAFWAMIERMGANAPFYMGPLDRHPDVIDAGQFAPAISSEGQAWSTVVRDPKTGVCGANSRIAWSAGAGANSKYHSGADLRFLNVPINVALPWPDTLFHIHEWAGGQWVDVQYEDLAIKPMRLESDGGGPWRTALYAADGRRAANVMNVEWHADYSDLNQGRALGSPHCHIYYGREDDLKLDGASWFLLAQLPADAPRFAIKRNGERIEWAAPLKLDSISCASCGAVAPVGDPATLPPGWRSAPDMNPPRVYCEACCQGVDN